MITFLSWILVGLLIALQPGLFYGFVVIALTFDKTLRRQILEDKPVALYSPQQYQQERALALERKQGTPGPRPGELSPDLAWPLYTLRQAGEDRKHVRQNLSAFHQRIWGWLIDTFVRSEEVSPRAGLLALLPLVLFLGGAFLSSWFAYCTYWAVLALFQVTDKTLVLSLRWQMRVWEGRRHKLRHTAAACMNCLHVTDWPAYACPGCGGLHYELMPGDLGTFYRKCGACNTRLPALPSRAAWQIQAVCKRKECRQPLPAGAGAIRDIRVPVFGDTAAGKTRFLYASLNSLLSDLDRAHIEHDYLDDRSREEATLKLKAIRADEDVPKTPEQPATAISLRLGKGKSSDFIHLFDAAGEQFSKPGNWDLEHGSTGTNYGSLRFLEDGQALAYVLDPFSIPAVYGKAIQYDQALVAGLQVAQKDPELSYFEVVNRLRLYGVKVEARRLAVVVSKADLLRQAKVDVPTDSEPIANWLSKKGVHNVVMGTRRDFAEVRFFTVASLDASAGRADDPGVPLRWLLAAHGVKVPGGDVLLAKPVRRRPGGASA